MFIATYERIRIRDVAETLSDIRNVISTIFRADEKWNDVTKPVHVNFVAFDASEVLFR